MVARDGKTEDDCWDFLGAPNKAGYGRFKVGGKLLLAHRVAYEITNGRIPEPGPGSTKYLRRELMHDCDRPPWCNPHHLKLGFHSENVADMYRRERGQFD